MRFAICILSLAFMPAALPTTAAPPDKAPPAQAPSGEQATAAAQKWLEKLGKQGLVLKESVKEKPMTATHRPSALGRVTKFELRQPGWWVTFAFKGELTADTPLETMRERFWYATLDRLPTPGLRLPGWEVRPQTPSSQVKAGVELLDYQHGRLKVRVKTKFFALYGRDPSVLVPADAGSPPGSYFQIRKPFPLDLTLEAPFRFDSK